MTKNNSPPNSNYSLEAEQSVIGGLILKNDALPDVSNVLSLDDFYDKRHQLLFKAIQNLASQGQPFDIVTLAEQLQKDGSLIAIGGGPYLGQLASNTPSAANIMAYARIVKEKSFERQLDEAYSRRAKGCIISSIEEQIDLINNPQATNYMSGIDLMNKELPEISWVINGIIPRTTRNLLVARPKTGKTYLALQWAIAVAAGIPVFGKYSVTQGQVLYMALEENEIRLRKTLDEVLIGFGIPMPKDFYYKTDCPPIDQGGLAHVTKWIQDMPNPILICIDVLKRFRAVNEGKNKGIYDADYEAVLGLKPISEKYNVAFLVTHHPNKRVANSVSHIQDTISGSHGLTGGVDNYMIMTNPNGRGKELAELYKDGRYYGNEHSGTMYLTRREEDEGNGITWLETTHESTQGDERREILQCLRDGFAKPSEIGEALGKNTSAVTQLLYKMMKSVPSLIEKTGYGKYSLLIEGECELDKLTAKTVSSVSSVSSAKTVSSVSSSDNSLINNGLSNETIEIKPQLETQLETVASTVSSSKGVNNSMGYEQLETLETVGSVFTPPLTQGKGQGKAETKGKPLNGKFVPLEVFITESRHRNLDVTKYLKKKATIQGTVQDHYYLKFVAAFKNEYNRSAGHVIRKVADGMGVGYPFSKTMAEILDSKEVQKEIHRGWTRIKTRLSSQYGEDELEMSKDELIEAGFIEYNVQNQTLKLLDN